MGIQAGASLTSAPRAFDVSRRPWGPTSSISLEESVENREAFRRPEMPEPPPAQLN
jgi:hypothetical protein